MTTRATITILTPADRHKACEWAMKTGEGTTITFRKKSRSSEQSAKMWAMLAEVAAQVEWYGVKMDSEDWKDIFSASLRHARVVPGIDKGTFVPLGMRTSTMTIEEMSNLIELIYAFGAEHSVVFKDPKQNEQSNSVADMPPSSTDSAATSADEAGMDDNHMSDVPASNPDREMLILAANEMFSISTMPGSTTEERREALAASKNEWKAKLRERSHEALGQILISANAVRQGKADKATSISVFADLFECDVKEIGGKL